MKKLLLKTIMAFGLFGMALTACGSGPSHADDPRYPIYLQYKEEGGNQSYEEWLESIKGEKGDKGEDGHSPVISIGDNGHWYIDGADTGVIAKGEQGNPGNDGISIVSITLTSSFENVDTYTITYSNGNTSTFQVRNGVDGSQGIQGNPGQNGHTPVITIGSNGHWIIDGNDTGITAQGPQGIQGETGPQGPQGEQGIQGEKGADGSSVLTGHGVPQSNLGKDNDSYINLDNWDFYVKVNNAWIKEGNIKGSDGQNGSQGEQGPQGETGVSIISAVIDNNGDLIITLSNGEEYNAGQIVDTQTRTVSYYFCDELIQTVEVVKGNKIEKPSSDIIPGYTITNWYYLDGNNHEDWKFFGYVVTEDMALYAECSLTEYTISFVDEQFDYPVDSMTVHYKDNIVLPSLECEGYSFIGWKDSNGILFTDSQYNLTSNLTLYSCWDAKVYKITLDTNGGLLDQTEVYVPFNSVISLPTPTLAHHSFIGWFYQETLIENNSIWDIPENKTLVAHWVENEPNKYFFDANGGEVDLDYMLMNFGDNYELPEPIKEGSFFNGWYYNNQYIEQTGVWGFDEHEESVCASFVANWIECSKFGFSLTLNNREYILDSVNESLSGIIIIPSAYNNLPVTEIGGGAFAEQTRITDFVIPNTIKIIGNGAFRDCYHLGEFIIPASVNTIGVQAFSGCSSLKSIVVPDSVTSIGESAFLNCTSLKTMTLPFIGESPTSYNWNIGFLFGGRSYPNIDNTSVPSNLKEIVLSESCTELKQNSLAECSSITSVSILNKSASISKAVFFGCNALNSLTLPIACDSLRDLFTEREDGDVMDYVPSSLKKINVVDGQKDGSASYIPHIIPNSYFAGCSDIVSIDIADCITTIGNNAFEGCSSLQSLVIPGHTGYVMSDRFIGDAAFKGCTSLTTLTIPYVETYIGLLFGNSSYSTTSYPASLKTLIVSDYCTSIADNAFRSCNIPTIVLPDTIETIGNYSFYACYSLIKGLLTIFENIVSIGDYSFANNQNLTEVVMGPKINSIGVGAFLDCPSLASISIDFGNSTYASIDGVIYTKDLKKIIFCPRGITSLSVPSGVTTIDKEAFKNCASLESITLPDTITTISERAFQGCTSLKSIVVPDSVTSIGYQAFNQCTSLASITLPFVGETPSTNRFFGYIFGAPSYSYHNSIVPKSLKTVVITDRYGAIGGDNAFNGCSNIVSIVVPDQVNSFGNGMFQGCSSLTSINMPSSLCTIAQNAFRDCTSITEVVVPNTVESIGSGAFTGCTSLASITLPFVGETPYANTFVGHIFGASTYSGNNSSVPRSLNTVVITSMASAIENNAFYGCYWIKEVILPETVESIGQSALRGSGITSFIIPKGITSIEYNSFAYCSYLTTITIPNSVTFIGGAAFSVSPSLVEIVFLGTIEEWNAIEKADDFKRTFITSPGVTVICTNGSFELP